MIPQQLKFNSALVIRKEKTDKKMEYIIEPVFDELLTRIQLNRVLLKMGLGLEELAFMWESFREHPTHTEAHFGINGYFIMTR
ncbi:MAG: hypothetical protein KAS32_30725 [Candidatus Peribacteraceae bacterium]|nr:hypothetical protein [Candidatus Peribacteraceae bacterium]